MNMKNGMARLLAVCLVLLLLGGTSVYAAPELDMDLFEKGKEALSLLSYGEYDRAYDAAGFSEDSLSREDFKRFIDLNYTEIYNGTVQRDVAVGWYDADRWYLAIPVLEPTDDSKETLVLTSTNGTDFDGLCFYTWGEVLSLSDEGEDTTWNVEYRQDTKVIQSDAPEFNGEVSDTPYEEPTADEEPAYEEYAVEDTDIGQEWVEETPAE